MSAYRYLILLLIVTVCACDISDNEVAPEASFLKIYNSPSFDASFIPIDVQQTADDGYIVLGARRIEDSDFTGLYLLRTDAEGNFVTEQNLSEQYIHPINNLMKIENNFYFVAMENTSLRAHLFNVNADSLSFTATPINGLSYPLYAAHDEDNNSIVLLTYDNNEKTSILSVVSTDGIVAGNGKQSFTIGAGSDVEAPIIQHFTRTGKQLPFIVGKTNSGIYYFNGFYNYTMSMVFTDFNGDGPDGVVQGQHDDGGISAAKHINGSTFALSRFNYGDNYISPKTELSMSTTTSSVDLETPDTHPFPELVPDAPVKIQSMEVDGREVLLYGSNTKGGQIILLAFSEETGELLGTKYLGFSDPYEIADFTPTSDEGLAIAGTVYVAGRFARICLIKLTKEELSAFID